MNMANNMSSMLAAIVNKLKTNCSCCTCGIGSMQTDQAVFRDYSDGDDETLGEPFTPGNVMDDYDAKGAILFVVGLLLMYGLGMFLLILSLICKSRSELEVIDHLRDLEEMRKAARKKRRSGRFSLRSQTSQAADSPELPAKFSTLEDEHILRNKTNDPEQEIFV